MCIGGNNLGYVQRSRTLNTCKPKMCGGHGLFTAPREKRVRERGGQNWENLFMREGVTDLNTHGGINIELPTKNLWLKKKKGWEALKINPMGEDKKT